MSFRYIGSKARIADLILQRVGAPGAGDGRFVDLFCGTGAVAEAAAGQGWPVVLNDMMHSSVLLSAARLIGSDRAPFMALGSYVEAIEQLNGCEGRAGFITREYSPASLAAVGIERRYFTEQNAQRIDAIRHQIAAWHEGGAINAEENALLVADLLFAVNRVANIAGTYGCFLATWQKQAANPLRLLARERPRLSNRVSQVVGEASAFVSAPEDVVYIDPPYTKRQYASYYHLLETIALRDEPVVTGTCGLRPWKEKASAFCYKSKALGALASLVEGLDARRIFISYSDEGHIDLAMLEQRLSAFAEVSTMPIQAIGRYRPNVTARDNGAQVDEYLVAVTKRSTTP